MSRCRRASRPCARLSVETQNPPLRPVSDPTTAREEPPLRAPTTGARLDSIDTLRGFVMVLMALDHARDFFHFGATQGIDPLDLSSTTAPIFLTRWITHSCAPTFVFLAGTGAFLSGTRGKSPRELSWFLLTRGLWLVVLEVTYVQWAGWTFAMDLHVHFAWVIWAIGWSMIVLAALVHLPVWAIGSFGLAMIATHNAFDGVKSAALGAWAPVWQVLHEGGQLDLGHGHKLAAAYPLIPWIGVMAAGYAFGQLLVQDAATRRRRLLRIGFALTAGFVALRLSNLYGEAKPWAAQSDALKTVGSILDCTKYPPSLCYLLMTLGPALLMLGWLDRGTPPWAKPLLVFGRVPMFFYLLYLPLLHGLAVLAHLAHSGRADWLNGVHPAEPPPSAGFGLAGVYLAWLVAVAILFPACTWFAEFKRRNRSAWLSYL